MERSTIHLLHKRGKSLREIASELGRSKNMVARLLNEPVDQPPAKRRRKSNVDPWREQIGEWLRQGLSGVRMLDLARADPDQPYRCRTASHLRTCRLSPDAGFAAAQPDQSAGRGVGLMPAR
jgi:transposase